MSEYEILIVLWTVLTIEVDMEQLSLPQCLSNSMDEVEASHLFVTNFRVQANEFWTVECVNECHCVTNCWQEDISTRFIWLWFNCKLNVVSIVYNEIAENVECFTEALHCNIAIFSCIRFSTLTAAPTDICFCAKFYC